MKDSMCINVNSPILIIKCLCKGMFLRLEIHGELYHMRRHELFHTKRHELYNIDDTEK